MPEKEKKGGKKEKSATRAEKCFRDKEVGGLETWVAREGRNCLHSGDTLRQTTGRG